MRIPKISQMNSFKTLRKAVTGVAVGMTTLGLQSCGELIFVQPAPIYRPMPTVVIPTAPTYYYRPQPAPIPHRRYQPTPIRHHR